MGVREEVLKMLREGLSPGEIARKRQVTLKTILAYLDEMVGRGQLRRSDIFFSVSREKRHKIMEKLTDGRSQNLSAIQGRLQRSGVIVDDDDVIVVKQYGDARHALGDMYEDIRIIEIQLHQLIRHALEKEFGFDESGWWRRGIPKEVRMKCQMRREDEDTDPARDPYCYTDLIDLKEILDKRWGILSQYLSPRAIADKKRLLRDLIRLNQIRRLVMHPVRGETPSEDDFEFIHSLKELLGFAL